MNWRNLFREVDILLFFTRDSEENLDFKVLRHYTYDSRIGKLDGFVEWTYTKITSRTVIVFLGS